MQTALEARLVWWWQKGLAAALVVLLVVLSYVAGKWGLADLYAKEARHAIGGWEKSHKTPPVDDWRRARQFLEKAAELEPLNPNHMEGLGQVYDWRTFNRRSNTPDVTAFREQALNYFRQVALRRPASPYGWANIALTKTRLGRIDDELTNAMRRAGLLGPWEPGVQLILADVGFGVWERLPADVQQIVVGNVERGAKLQADDMLRIAAAHGKQSLICMTQELIQAFKPRGCP